MSEFGKHFREADYKWSKELCLQDSDGDGEPNGVELGDPCCLWQEGELPSRSWQLSDPGNKKSLSAFPYVNCSELRLDFDRFYFHRANDEDNSNPILWTLQMLGQLIFHPIDSTIFLKNYFFPRGKDGEPRLRSTKNTSTFILGILFIIYAYLGTFRDMFKMSGRQWILMVAGAILWTDIASGLLHVVLDNPLLNHWPIIGPEAAAFQGIPLVVIREFPCTSILITLRLCSIGHHYDPSAITRGPWYEFIREHHVVAVLLTLQAFVNPFYAPVRIFISIVHIFLHLMMAAHRWSHMLPSKVPWLVRIAQGTFLISQDHHSSHHATYDNNFAIFNGPLSAHYLTNSTIA